MNELTEDQKRGLAILKAGEKAWRENGASVICERVEAQLVNPPPFAAEDATERNLGRRELYQEGWDARRASVPYNPSWVEAKRDGWNDAQRDDFNESEFYAAGDDGE